MLYFVDNLQSDPNAETQAASSTPEGSSTSHQREVEHTVREMLSIWAWTLSHRQVSPDSTQTAATPVSWLKLVRC